MYKKSPVIAAIDLGTNSFHLIITAVSNKGTLHVFTSEKEMVRLGSGSGEMKQILPEAMDRGISCLNRFAELAKSHNAEIVAVATSAVREASNKEVFIRKVKDSSGIDVNVISGDEEGRLIYIGVIHALPVVNKNILVIDIGGGSTETVVGKGGHVIYGHSTKLGAIRLTRRFELDVNPSQENINKCRDFIKGEWAPVIERLKDYKFDTVVGTSGTILNLVVMAMGNNEFSIPEILNGISIDTVEIFNVINRLASASTLKERYKIPKIDSQRADILLGGSLILEFILKELKVKNILISAFALREGIVFDYQNKKQAKTEYHHLSRLRYESVLSAANHFHVNLAHAEHVHRITLQLFDALKPIHKLGDDSRELLEAASILHDVGYHISHDMHHKHSYYIISNCVLPGFTNDEKDLIANIARYHRKSHPKKKHENFINLTEENQNIVKVLAGILRIAEGIDRRQMQYVNDIRTKLSGNNLIILLIPAKTEDDIDIEIWGADRRLPLIEETLGITIQVRKVKN
jgi:exopolyphosphatase/guanosine-5'-triphosphate,3'-diphosphate pyrophosphatase